MRQLSLLLLSTLVSVQVFANPELKGSPEELRQFLHPSEKTVTIYADAEEKAYSDTAIISLVITTERKQLAEAIAANNDLRSSIRDGLNKQGIPNEDIKSSKFSTSPQYGWFGKKPDSYKVTNRMAVKISEEEQLRTIASVADASGPVDLADISFEHSEVDAFKLKVKAKALDKIMQQKAFYEQSLNVRLTPVYFRDANIHHFASQGARVLSRSAAPVMAELKSASNDASIATEPTSFDEIVYRAELSVDFQIQPAK